MSEVTLRTFSYPISSMKYLTPLLAIMVCSFTASSQTWTSIEKATKHKGNTINVLGYISDVRFTGESQQIEILLQRNETDSTPILRLLVWEKSGNRLKDSLETYLHQYVQVKGKVQLRNGSAVMPLYRKEQISITREPLYDFSREPW